MKRALAASFVVTFAAGCDSKPAQPAATPTVDVGSVPVASAPATVAPAPLDSAAAAPSASSSAGAVAALPPAPSVGRVTRNPDGTCTWFASLPAPAAGQRRFMNPPPPHQVQCPPGDGGTSGP